MSVHGDPAALESLLAHREWVRALARRLVGPGPAADDLEQATWVSALQRPPEEPESARPWLGRVLRHHAINRLRGNRRRERFEAAGARRERVRGPDEIVAEAEIHRHVVDAVMELAPLYRTAVLMRFFEGLTTREIAGKLDVPVETVRTRLKRAIVLLRERLDVADRGRIRTDRYAALCRLSWGAGGAAMHALTKAGLVAAGVFLIAGVMGWRLMRDGAEPAAETPAQVALVSSAPTTAAREPLVATVPAEPAPRAQEAVPEVVPEEPAPAATPPKPAPERRAASLFGEVWQRSPERPVGGASVRLTNGAGADRVAVSDARGRFRFADLPPSTRGTVRVRVEERVAEPVAVPALALGEERFVGVLWLEPAVSVDVLVTSLEGNPIPGARVSAFQRPVLRQNRRVFGATHFEHHADAATWRDLRDPAAAATTDPLGHAILSGLVAAHWQFVAEEEGFALAARVETVEAGRRNSIHLTLSPGLDLAGRVEDPLGKPMQGLALWACRGDFLVANAGEATPRAMADADGRFVLHGLTEGTTTVWVAFPGASPCPVGRFRIPTSGPVRIVVRGAGIFGSIRDAATREPIPGVRVCALVGACVEAVTDAGGTYEIPFFAKDAVLNDLTVDGYEIVEGPRVTPRTGVPVHDDARKRIDLVVRRVSGVTGRVTHAGSPVRGARVLVFVPSEPTAFRTLSASTDGEGRYVVGGVGGMRVLVKVEAPGLVQRGFPHQESVAGLLRIASPARWTLTVPQASDAQVDVELVDGVDVVGSVVDLRDEPVEGAELIIDDSVTHSAADGTFALRGVDVAASPAIVATKQGFMDASAGLEDDPLPVTVRMTPCPMVRGVVRATDGVLASGWVQYGQKHDLTVQGRGGEPPSTRWEMARSVSIGLDGEFRFAAPWSEGTLLLRAGGEGHGPSATLEVEVVKGSSVGGLRVDVGPSRAIRGRALAEDGTAISGAQVEVDRARYAFFATLAATSDAEGRFQVDGLPPGVHGLRVVADGFLPASLDADAAATEELAVRLVRTLEVGGVVVLSDGTPVEGATVSLFPRGAGDNGIGSRAGTATREGGTFRCPVPPGVYFAVVTQGACRLAFERSRFEGVAAGTTDARFVIETRRKIAGRVLGADGVALAGAEVHLVPENGPKFATSARTDSAGRFEIATSSDGPYRLYARPPDSVIVGFQMFIGKRYLRAVVNDVTPNTRDLTVRLPVGMEIEGTLLDGSTPCEGGYVVAQPLFRSTDPGPVFDLEGHGSTARTDAAGRFVLTGLEPGSYELVQDDGRMERTPLVGGERVAAGTRALRLSRPQSDTISGRLLDEKGAPFAGIYVVATAAGGTVRLAAMTEPNGAFVIRGVPTSATYSVVAGVSKRKSAAVTGVCAGARDVRLQLARGLSASGTLRDGAGKPITPATLVFRLGAGDYDASVYVGENGRFAVDNLLPGTYRVEQMTSRNGGFVYLPCGTLRAGDDGVDLRRGE